MEKVFNIKRKEQDGCVMLQDRVYIKGNMNPEYFSEVSSGETARLDRICAKRNGNSDTIDAVMYANGIINPFAVNEGDILIIPVEDVNLYAPNPPEVFKKKSKKGITDYGRQDTETEEFIELTNKANNLLKSTTDPGRMKRIKALQDKFSGKQNALTLEKRSNAEVQSIKDGTSDISLNKY